jgi:hypothetical protein
MIKSEANLKACEILPDTLPQWCWHVPLVPRLKCFRNPLSAGVIVVGFNRYSPPLS